ncbi:ABC transporter substrate-binding protein [Pengzhenrongella frigida]|uniref:Extracellular solute-binding protein n=1 Tax=Pengzhenrongella frigida TaxID=1259133 RepID=A0A4Q5N1U7_9MICO|nr:extracellular solute-binding protein [Cellulomonas sp. HLT2-17]RYV52108.1 extracellular solute-binding protein [Cellulomonas sp. HLT2-17]
MKRSIVTGLGIAAALSLALAGCSSDADAESAPETTPSGPVTVTLAGWSLATTPEFQTLADAFHAANPDITVEAKEYDATNYDTQMTADLAAGTAPDIYVQKNLKNFFTYQNGAQLMDLSDVADTLDKSLSGLDAYEVEGATYAIPYRQDSWYLYYNRDLFDAAGMEYPDGSWTWDDYATNADEMTAALAAAGSPALGTYQHTWQSPVQGFALAQTPDADLLSGDFSYLAPYYESRIALQDSGAQASYGTATTNSLTYQAQFGTQKAAMMPMGSWYVATLIAQQASGDSETFNWGIAPAPQLDSSTVKNPVTFGDPTGLGINPAIDDDKAAAAKAFLAYVGSEDAALALAKIGITPAYASDVVTEAYFGLKGVPTDDLSRFAFSTHDTKPENPVSKYTTGIQNILNDAHSIIMSGSSTVEDALAEAESRAENEVLNQ